MSGRPGQDRVIQRISDVGYWYRIGDVELGPFTVDQEEDPKFDAELAAKLGVKSKEIVAAQFREVQRPTTFLEVAEVLGSTIRQDTPTKLILFAAGILTFTEEDQVNILMSGESSGGKSYNALEVAGFFPTEGVIIIATASPTAFFHDIGSWDDEAKVLRVNLRQKVLLFLDQPHFTLMERLRPLLSHDRRELLYKITDKSKRGALRTKNVILEGYPTVVFCAARLSLDEQERTRVFILSPETGPEKLEESLLLTATKVGNRRAFAEWVEKHPRRRWLKSRIADIRGASIKDVVIGDPAAVYERFREAHRHLAPRHQRDLPRILSLIKAHALLNHRQREPRDDATIAATREDEEAGFWLYSLIAKPNELGLSPQVYEIYEAVIKPHLDPGGLLRKEDIHGLYFKAYGRHLAWQRLEREILPALEASGLISLQPDPDDRRRTVVYSPDGYSAVTVESPRQRQLSEEGPTITYNISSVQKGENSIVSNRGTHRGPPPNQGAIGEGRVVSASGPPPVTISGSNGSGNEEMGGNAPSETDMGSSRTGVLEARDKVLRLLRKDRRAYLTTAQVAYSAEAPVETVRRILGSLAEDGLVVEGPAECWRVTR